MSGERETLCENARRIWSRAVLADLFGFTAGNTRGSESDRWRKELKIWGTDLSQYRQWLSDTEAHGKGIEPGLASGKGSRHQPDEDIQHLMDCPHAPAHPAHYPRQFDIRAQQGTGCLQALGLFDGTDDLLDLGQSAAQTGRQTVRQQAESARSSSAVPPGDAGSGRGHPWIGPVAHEPAAALGV